MTLPAIPQSGLDFAVQEVLPPLLLLARTTMLGGVLFLLMVMRPLDWTLGGPGRSMSRAAGRVTFWAALIVVFRAGMALLPAADGLLSATDRVRAVLSAPVGVKAALAEFAAAILIILLLPLGVPGLLLLLLACVDIAAAVFASPTAMTDDRAVLALAALHWFALAMSLGAVPPFVAALGRVIENVGWRAVTARFARVGLLGIILLLISGIALMVWTASASNALLPVLYGTRYGVMLGVKSLLTVGMLVLVIAVARTVAGRTTGIAPLVNLWRLADVELAIGLAALLVTVALLASPRPGADAQPIAAWPDITAPFQAAALHLDAMPNLGDALTAWSDSTLHRAGLATVIVGALALLACAGLRVARHWPLLVAALGVALLARAQPWTWSGPDTLANWLETPLLLTRVVPILLIVLGLIEWRARGFGRGRNGIALLLPLALGIGGLAWLLLAGAGLPPAARAAATVLAAPLALLLIAAAASHWLELRLDRADTAPAAWTFAICVLLGGLLLLAYPIA